MKILVIGSGGREHAICWKFRQSPKVEIIYCAPGNAGIGMVAQCVNTPVDDIEGLVRFAKDKEIDLTVVGPEYPLTLGVVDRFRSENLRIFGASQAAAALEGSKSFAKMIMEEAKVPTAAYRVAENRADAARYVKELGAPIVVKADGLASGKGVFVCKALNEALEAVESLYQDSPSQRVVIEEFLEGVEVSYIIATNGEQIVPMAPSHDYKRIFDNDEGPNTGGMGSVCPTPRFTSEDEERVLYEVMVPTIARMKQRGTPFTGFLYAGLMLGPNGRLSVLEFNTRLGDPETQSIMRRLKSDFADLLFHLSTPASESANTLGDMQSLEWDARACVCIVAAAAGYPGTPQTGDEITGLHLAESLPEAVVFHAGTRSEGGKILTTGGRVLGITALGDDIAQARANAYKAADLLQFRGVQVRRDIGIQ